MNKVQFETYVFNLIKVCLKSACILCTDAFITALAMSRLVGTFDIITWEISAVFPKIFIVAFNSYLLHQFLQEDVNVLWGDAGLLHRSTGALLAVLAESPHLDNSSSVSQLHMEDNHHPVGRPASFAHGTTEP